MTPSELLEAPPTAAAIASARVPLAEVPVEGAGCHGGAQQMARAAAAAGKSGTLERYAQDYPAGPHDQPQSMCP
ncbi:MAG: chlorophyllide reductase subunit Y, partial [Gammaproteobacteria bacterium]